MIDELSQSNFNVYMNTLKIVQGLEHVVKATLSTTHSFVSLEGSLL